jgi:uncharacterized membrane protein YwaF
MVAAILIIKEKFKYLKTGLIHSVEYLNEQAFKCSFVGDGAHMSIKKWVGKDMLELMGRVWTWYSFSASE